MNRKSPMWAVENITSKSYAKSIIRSFCHAVNLHCLKY